MWVRSFATIEELRLALLAFKRTYNNSGCWRNTTIGVQPKCDATSSGWTRQRRSEYRQTTVQESLGQYSRASHRTHSGRGGDYGQTAVVVLFPN